MLLIMYCKITTLQKIRGEKINKNGVNMKIFWLGWCLWFIFLYFFFLRIKCQWNWFLCNGLYFYLLDFYKMVMIVWFKNKKIKKKWSSSNLVGAASGHAPSDFNTCSSSNDQLSLVDFGDRKLENDAWWPGKWLWQLRMADYLWSSS